MVSPVAHNVNHSLNPRTGTVRSPMVRVCWAVSLDGKGCSVTKVHVKLFVCICIFFVVNCNSINLHV